LAANQSFSNDWLDRVTGFTPAATAPSSMAAETYGYDLSGNRAAFGVGANAYAFTTAPASNHLTGITGGAAPQSLAYDAAGTFCRTARPPGCIPIGAG